MMMNYLSFKKEAISLDLKDSAMLIKYGLVSDFERIAKQILVLFGSSAELVYAALLESKKEDDKDRFIGYFKDEETIFSRIWESPEFDELIGAVIRKSIRYAIETLHGGNIYESTRKISTQDVPRGKNNFNFPENLIPGLHIGKHVDVRTLGDYRFLIMYGTQFFSGGDWAAANFYDVLYQPMDLVTKSGHITNLTANGCLWFPVNILSFTDEASKEYYNKFYNAFEKAYPQEVKNIKPAEEYKSALEQSQQYFTKANDPSYWDLIIPNFDLAKVMHLVMGSCTISAKVEGSPNIVPIEIVLQDEKEENHRLVFSNLDLYHFVSMIVNVSSKSTLTVKARLSTGELVIMGDITAPDFSGGAVTAFAFLNPLDISNSNVIESFQSIDVRELMVFENIRDRERLAKKIGSFDEKIKSIGDSIRISEGIADNPQVEENTSADYFYQAFVQKCLRHIESYTEIVPCMNDLGTPTGESIRCPILNNFKKNQDGSFILRDGKKVIDYDYVYRIREAFWYNNKNFQIEELIAFFISKGKNPKYKSLSVEILGYDCNLSEDSLVEDLIKAGHLCVENIEIDYETKNVKKLVYSYASDYAKGNYYDKMTRLFGRNFTDERSEENQTSFVKDLSNYFGADLASVIIERQESILKREANKPMTFLIENPESSTDRLSQIELGPDNEILWSSSSLLDIYAWRDFSQQTLNPKMSFISKSKVLSEFYEWMLANPSDPILLGLNIYELFDACVVPLSARDYIQTYVLPNWTVKKDENGKQRHVLSPIDLPFYTYTLGAGKGKQQAAPNPSAKKKSSAKVVQKQLRWTKSDLLKWNGNSDYVKDTSKGMGKWEKFLSPGGLPTNLKWFKYDDSVPAGKAAKLAWEKVVDGLMSAAIDPYQNRKSKATQVCNTMFNIFLREHLDKKTQGEIEKLWNEKYNSLIMPKYQKYPFFSKNHRYFGLSDTSFSLMGAQSEGVKSFISRDNSAVLGHEVGYGKTSSAIAITSHLFNTGEAGRILLSVPDIVYEKWKKEILGEGSYRGLLADINIVDLYNARPDALMLLKNYTDDERVTLSLFGKLFYEDYKNFVKRLQDKRFDILQDPLEDIMKMLINRVPLYSQYNALVDFEKEIQYEYTRTHKDFEESVSKIQKRYEKISTVTKKKFNQAAYDKEAEQERAEYSQLLTRRITGAVMFRKSSLYDDLGIYKTEALLPNSIILCTHGAIGMLRPDILAGIESFSIIDDAFDEVGDDLRSIDMDALTRTESLQLIDEWRVGNESSGTLWLGYDIGSRATRSNDKTNVFRLPVSLKKLNVDAFMVDEIHEFNNIISQAKRRFIEARQSMTPTKPQFEFGKLTSVGTDSRSRATLQYYTEHHGSRTVSNVNCLALARTIQNNNRKHNKANNTLLLSATPFTDSPLFQMISVFSIMNYELLLKSGISGVFDIFNQYATERWKLDLTHDKKLGSFPTVDKYKNIYANSNLIRMFVNFKISDVDINSKRPEKFIFPDQAGKMQEIVGGEQEVNAYVPMNAFQMRAKNLVMQYLHGEINYSDVFPKALDESTEYDAESAPNAEYRKVELETDLLSLKDVSVNEIVLVTSSGSHWELIEEDASSMDNWAPADIKLRKEKNESADSQGTDEEGDEENQAETGKRDTIEALEKGNLSEEDTKKGKTIVAMGADENISVSPYTSRTIVCNDLPPLVEYDTKTRKKIFHPENFVENSPKLLYISECIKTVFNYQKVKGEKSCGQIIYLDRQRFKFKDHEFNPLELLRDYLVNRADIDVQAHEIAIITGKLGRSERQDIANGFNAGKYKILIGTSAMKQGVDLQENTAVMYIAQADYVPSTIMQLEGRGWRQGNGWANIRIVYVLSYGSLDGFQLSKVNQKINQIKHMLEGEGKVYNMNEIQFDKDIDAMKLELETNLEKKAELKYQLTWAEDNDKFIKYQSQLNLFEKIQSHIGKYLPMWEDFVARLNLIGKGLERISLDDIKEQYIKILSLRMADQQEQHLKSAISEEQKRLESENQAYELVTKNELDAAEKELARVIEEEKDLVVSEVGLSPVVQLPVAKKAGTQKTETDQEIVVSDKMLAAEQKVEELKARARKPLRNKGERDEQIRSLNLSLREMFKKEKEAITVTDEETLQWLSKSSAAAADFDGITERLNEAERDLEKAREMIKNPELYSLQYYQNRIPKLERQIEQFKSQIKEQTDAMLQGEMPSAENSTEPQGQLDLFTISQSSETTYSIKYAHRPLTVTTPHNVVMAQADKMVDVLRRPIKFDAEYANLSQEVKAKNQRYIDVVEQAGYAKGMDISEQMNEQFSTNQGKVVAKHLWDAIINDYYSFRSSTNKGTIVRDFYAYIKDESYFDGLIETARKQSALLKTKLDDREGQVALILTDLQASTERKTREGLYDVKRQVERFDKTNILLVKKK